MTLANGVRKETCTIIECSTSQVELLLLLCVPSLRICELQKLMRGSCKFVPAKTNLIGSGLIRQIELTTSTCGIDTSRMRNILSVSCMDTRGTRIAVATESFP